MDKNTLHELVEQQLISPEQAERISVYFAQKPKPDSTGRALTAFAVLGAALVGLGIILVVAHNWDNLSRTVKLVLAFLPTIIGQLAVFYTLFKKNGNPAWRESSATFLIFAVGATISLVAQIYNISGDFPGFMLTWVLLSLPLAYILPSNMAAMLSLLGITVFAFNTTENHAGFAQLWFWIPLFAALLPHYFWLLKKSNDSNFTRFFNVLLPLGCLVGIIRMVDFDVRLMSVSTVLFASLLLFFGKKWSKFQQTLGAILLLFTLFAFSYKNLWRDFQSLPNNYDLLGVFVLVLLAAVLVFAILKQAEKPDMQRPLEWIFLPMLALFGLGVFISPEGCAVVVNILLIFLGIYYLRNGLRENDLRRMNLGLLTLIILIGLRFFDLDISYALKGLVFILMGIAFFVANSVLVKRRKAGIPISENSK